MIPIRTRRSFALRLGTEWPWLGSKVFACTPALMIHPQCTNTFSTIGTASKTSHTDSETIRGKDWRARMAVLWFSATVFQHDPPGLAFFGKLESCSRRIPAKTSGCKGKRYMTHWSGCLQFLSNSIVENIISDSSIILTWRPWNCLGPFKSFHMSSISKLGQFIYIAYMLGLDQHESLETLYLIWELRIKSVSVSILSFYFDGISRSIESVD